MAVLTPKRPASNEAKGSDAMEGQRDLVSRRIMGISGVPIWVIGVIAHLLRPPDPPKYLFCFQGSSLDDASTGVVGRLA